MSLPFKRTPRARMAEDTPRVRLEREGRDRIRRISQAVEKVPWSSSLLNLLWIGGPVTFIGAIGGYYIGYGHLPTVGNLLFFIFFAVVTSVAGILTTIVNNYRHAGRYRKVERQITRVIDALPELIMMTRDLEVERLEGDARRREAAMMLLRKQDLSADGIELAVRELIGDTESARTLADIDTYRRIGLKSRINDLIAAHAGHIEPQLSELGELAPEAAALLRERFYGRTPDLDNGVPRGENFIERVLAAIEQDDELLMTLADVEEMLTLAFELINGREIPMLVFEYRGRWRLAQSLDALEQARARYRIGQALGLSRLKALTVYLAEASDTLVEDAASGLRAEVLLERCREAIEDLAARIARLAADPQADRSALREQADVLANAMRLFRHMRDGYDEVGRHHAALLRASQRWERISSHSSDQETRLRLGPGRRGLRIRESVIVLDDHAKTQICAQLAHLIRQLHARPSLRARLPHETPQAALSVDTDSAKRLAIEIALALEPHIHLSRPEVQRAINSTNAADFTSLEPGYSAATKAALGAAMVKEVDDDLSRSAESLALALVRHYQVELEPAAIEFLHRQYGARKGTLEMLSKYEQSSRSPVSFLSHRMPPIGRTPRHWYRALVVARQALER
ncbi:hypothetical protein [Halotalea alkalilenta]|uniref:hypothetical protein n=1 Tax=Halotalea alkalilenta TaxID=376489 RepID=UPI000483F692|nr:hypothetical protein [Halotalea alkalilenta]